jgi:hypothetical protein
MFGCKGEVVKLLKDEFSSVIIWGCANRMEISVAPFFKKKKKKSSTSYKYCQGMVIICSKGFWALWDNIITTAMVMLLKKVLNFYMLLCGHSMLK